MRTPAHWPRMTWHAKAAYLMDTHQARNYSEACSMLAKRPRRKSVPAAPVVMRLPYADN